MRHAMSADIPRHEAALQTQRAGQIGISPQGPEIGEIDAIGHDVDLARLDAAIDQPGFEGWRHHDDTRGLAV